MSPDLTLDTPPPSRHAAGSLLPADDPLRVALHNEVHSRPPARIRLPALIVFVAVLNEGVTRDSRPRSVCPSWRSCCRCGSSRWWPFS